MVGNRLYYGLKPLLPRGFRAFLRRRHARWIRRQTRDCWPILPGSERAPRDWPGWPDGKQFTVVLTHDVEGRAGLEKCRKVMELEEELGFRSSFNFIPEGDYRVPRELREELARKGFEVGVHDLHHDGKLYRSRRDFAKKAQRINAYLREWQAVGFRSGFMLHELDWLHDLNISYEASTFDTDPFEPQPDGMGTIFPFRVEREPECVAASSPSPAVAVGGPEFRHGNNGSSSGICSAPSGYVELPYTLPQDSTLFLFLAERGPDLWLQKLDWIARHGGMALVNVHPDYMRFEGEPVSQHTYPAGFYRQLLTYIRERHDNLYWQPLPREVSHFVNASCATESGLRKIQTNGRPHPQKPKIWIDLDNTPHVPFFEPIVEELKKRGFPLMVTARDAFQVYSLADQKGLQCAKIGRHFGKNRLMKGLGLAVRAMELAPLVLRERPALAVSHGARSQVLLGNCARIPSLLIDDYEFSEYPAFMRPTRLLVPEVIPSDSLSLPSSMVEHYPGIKEDVYCWKLRPDPDALRALGIAESDLVVTVRPPATEAHYHNPESERLFEAFMERACRLANCRIVLLPRNQKQGTAIRSRWPRWFDNGRTIIPGAVLDGLNLIWHSDLVVSGGGTMNREAAALGVPVYSIFRGATGAVDRHLAAEERLVLIESEPEVQSRIILAKRPRRPVTEVTSNRTLQYIVNAIERIAGQLGAR